MKIEDERPTARMARVRLDALIAVEAEEAERDDAESTLQAAAPEVPDSTASPISGEDPPSDRTVMMTWPLHNHSR